MCIAALLITAARILLDCEINHLGFWQELEGMDMAAHYMGTGFDAMWLKMLSAATLVKLCKIWYVQSLMYYTVLWLAKFVLLHLVSALRSSPAPHFFIPFYGISSGIFLT